MVDTFLLLALVGSVLRATTPLLLAALGGMFSERSGVVNIALEGIILFGALAAAVVTQLVEAPYLTQNPRAVVWFAPWLGVLAAVIAGGLIGWLHALVSIRYQADQIISGTAINLMGVGIPALVLMGLYNNSTTSTPLVNRLPQWGVGPFSFSPLVYLAFLLVPVAWYVLFKTPFGLRLRAVGEHPDAAASVGVGVRRMRYYGVIISGVLAGLAGAYLSVGHLNQLISEMSGGRGFIALAALIFGKWHPLGVLGATLLFGSFEAVATLLGGARLMPSTIVSGIPFILTMLVLAGFIGRAIPPKAIGKAYDRA
ncbi:MAG: ABC transporter permease [Truepera sp.]|nr:ABC transporter permease [Truepera sp.]